MNTPSHLLMTAALRKALPRLKMPRSAVLWGSVAPDLPLYLLTFGGLVYYTNVAGWSMSDAAKRIFDFHYFEDPVWISLHNVFHSPVSIGCLWIACFLLKHWYPKLSRWFCWFLAACFFHSFIDILTHFDDGPVLFWPLNWEYRFQSPVSYWDRRHYGSQFMWFELGLVVALTGYLVVPWAMDKFRRDEKEEDPVSTD